MWVIDLWKEVLCFGKLHQIHLATGIPFPALSSDFIRPITARGPYHAASLSIVGAHTKISDAGQPLWGNRCLLCLPAVEVLRWKHGKGQPPQRFYPSGQVTVLHSAKPEFSLIGILLETSGSSWKWKIKSGNSPNDSQLTQGVQCSHNRNGERLFDV